MQKNILKKKFISICLMMIFIFNLNPLLGDEASDYFSYITALENLKKKEFTSLVISELFEYLNRFPNASNLDEMQFKIATIYSENKDTIRSLFFYIEFIYLYPNSKHISVVKDRVRSLLIKEKKFKSLRENIERIINPAITDSTKEGVLFTFIRDMNEYRFKHITKLLIDVCDQFLKIYPNSSKTDEVQFWKAELLASDKKYRKALAEYMKLTFLYDVSIFVTSSKLRMAELFTDKLNLHQNAVLTLEEFLLEFPDDPQAAFAQYRMAQIIAKEKNKYLEAINAYQAVAEKYPESLEAVPALFEAAGLYEDKFKEYDQAISVYYKVVQDFPNDIKAPYALAEAAIIYEKRLKDYTNAADVYFKVFDKYPESKIAPESLYAAAEIYEKQLKDFNQAMTLYRSLIDQYPNIKIAKKASKRIEKLSKEMAK
ncbi:MAG: tol-pal system YbgF family protein [bacterium]